MSESKTQNQKVGTPENLHTDPMAMFKSEQTKSYGYLLRFAAPYTFFYVFLPSLLSQLHLPVSGLIWSLLVVLFLNLVVIVVFHKLQVRQLEKIECYRIAVLTAALTLIVTSILMVLSLYDYALADISYQNLKKDGVIPMLIINGSIGIVINYTIVFYGLWFLQKLWFKQRAELK